MQNIDHNNPVFENSCLINSDLGLARLGAGATFDWL